MSSPPNRLQINPSAAVSEPMARPGTPVHTMDSQQDSVMMAPVVAPVGAPVAAPAQSSSPSLAPTFSRW